MSCIGSAPLPAAPMDDVTLATADAGYARVHCTAAGKVPDPERITLTETDPAGELGFADNDND